MKTRIVCWLSLWVSVASADIVTNQWIGLSSDWNDPANWKLGVVPDANTVAQFPATAAKNIAPAIEGNLPVYGLSIQEDYTLDWTFSGSGSMTLGPGGLFLYGQRGVTTFDCNLILNGNQTWLSEPNGNNGCKLRLTGSLTGHGDLSIEQWVRPTVRFTADIGSDSRPMLPSEIQFDGSLTVRGYATTTIDLGPQSNDTAFSIGGSASQPRPFFAESPGIFQLKASSTTGASIRVLNYFSAPLDGNVLWFAASGSQPPTFSFPNGGELAGPLGLYRNQTMGESLGAFLFSGTWTLPQDRGTVAALHPAPQGYNVHAHSFSGALQDGDGPFANPLLLISPACDFKLQTPAENVRYSYGTVVDLCGTTYNDRFASARVDVDSTSRLGDGDLTILPGGSVRLGSLENLSEDASISLQSLPVSLSCIDFPGSDFSRLTPSSHGVVGFSGSITDDLDLSLIGDGECFLSSTSAGVFRGNNLLPGNGNVWRFGGGIWANTFTLEKGCLNGDARLQVGSPVWHGNGDVLLRAANTFTGPTDVYGMSHFNREPDITGSGYVGGTLTFQSPASGNPLGNTDEPLTLHNARVKFQLGHTVPLYVKDTVAFEGRSSIVVDCNIHQEDFTVGSLERLNRGFLSLYPGRNRLGGYERLYLNSLPEGYQNNIFPAWFIEERNSKFLTYDEDLGLIAYTPSVTSLANATASDVVSSAATTLSSDAECYALSVTGEIKGGKTIHIGAGGLILGNVNLTANLDFGDNEALIYTGALWKNVTGVITARGGLSLCGRQLTPLQDNLIEGPISLCGGNLCINPDEEGIGHSLGNVNNPIFLNGGSLSKQANTLGDRLLASRTITLGTSGGMLNGKGLTVESPITGPGMLVIGSSGGSDRSGEIILASPNNDYTGGTFMLSPGGNGGSGSLTVRPTSSVGTGDVVVNAEVWATFEGNANLAPTATVQVALLGKAYFTSDAPAVGRLIGAGSVYLGHPDHSTTLLLGGSHQDSTFYGRLCDAPNTFGNAVRKVGSGTLTLYGNHDFSGALEVSEGILDLRASLAGDLLLEENGTLLVKVEDDLHTTHPAHVNGDVLLSGTVTLGLPQGARPSFGDEFPILSSSGEIDLSLAQVAEGYRLFQKDNTLFLTYGDSATLILLR